MLPQTHNNLGLSNMVSKALFLKPIVYVWDLESGDLPWLVCSLYSLTFTLVINPRRACARAIVVSLSVCPLFLLFCDIALFTLQTRDISSYTAENEAKVNSGFL